MPTEFRLSGMDVRWEHFVNSFASRAQLAYLPDGQGSKHITYVRELSAIVSTFQDRTDSLIEMYENITRTVDQLATCPYTVQAFAEHLGVVQKTIDRLNLEGYSNLDAWVAELDAKIEGILAARLSKIVERWCAAFAKEGDEGASAGDVKRSQRRKKVADPNDSSVSGCLWRGMGVIADATGHLQIDPDANLTLTSLTHEIRIQNQVIYLDPPLEQARASWYHQLQQWLGIVCGLKRIQSSRYEIGLKIRTSSPDQDTYASLLRTLPSATVERPFSIVEAKLQQISAYVAKWLQFQSLWDLESDYVYSRLGDSLSAWQQLLLEIRKTRSTFDNSETQRSFGVAVIDYEQVQSKVNAKYDTWQRDILSKFGGKLSSSMKETHAAILKARHDLENHSLEGTSTASTVTFITFVQEVKRKVTTWSPEITIFGSGQKTLERQRYQFPPDWLYVDQVEGEWSAFNEILARKNASIQDQLGRCLCAITFSIPSKLT